MNKMFQDATFSIWHREGRSVLLFHKSRRGLFETDSKKVPRLFNVFYIEHELFRMQLCYYGTERAAVFFCLTKSRRVRIKADPKPTQRRLHYCSMCSISNTKCPNTKYETPQEPCYTQHYKLLKRAIFFSTVSSYRVGIRKIIPATKTPKNSIENP